MPKFSEKKAPGTWTAEAPYSPSTGQGRTGIAAIVLLAAAGLWTLHSFLPAVGWAGIFAISLWPIYQRCASRWPDRQSLTLPAAFTSLILLAVVVPLAMVAEAVVHDGASVALWLSSARADGLATPDILHHLPFGDQLAAWWQSTLRTPQEIVHLSSDAKDLSLINGRKILSAIAHRVLLLGFMLLTLFYLLREGRSVAQALEIGTRRAFGEPGQRVARQAVNAIQGAVNGLVVVGFGEGLVMGLSYALAGASHAALLGLLTGLLSVIPFGALLAVLVAAGSLAAGGNILAACIVSVFGGGVIFLADHFVRPIFIGEATRLPFPLVLLGILGGIEAWGLIGLVLGPAIIAVLMLLWREFVGAEKGPLNPLNPPAPDMKQSPPP